MVAEMSAIYNVAKQLREFMNQLFELLNLEMQECLRLRAALDPDLR
jgi:hypothetical protein